MKTNDIDRLIKLLQGVASYNDKGYIWMSHGPEKLAAEQQGYRAALERFITEVGEASIPPAVLGELRAEGVAQDGSGLVYERVAALLGRPV